MKKEIEYNTPPLEEVEAQMLTQRLRYNDYTFTHIANESGLPPKVAMIASKKKKMMWVSRWVPDFMIILKRDSLLFIELKRKKKSLSKVSEEQLQWIEKLNNISNVEAIIAYGAEQAIQLINKYEKS